MGLARSHPTAPDQADMQIIAHRGDNRQHTENTRAAFDSSLARGLTALELDLITIADGSVVIFHDENLWRLAGRSKRADELTLEQFQGFFPELLTLNEFTRLYRERPITVNFEIKDHPETLERSIDRIRLFAQPIVSSFYPEAAEHAADSALEAAYLFGSTTDFKKHYERQLHRRIFRLHLHKDIVLGADPVLDSQLSDYEVYCYTVNDRRSLKELSQRPYVRGLFTDDPDALRG